MITGQGSSSLRKQDQENGRIQSVGYTKTKFAHKAAAGATGINLTSLTTPPEMSTNGFTNPSSAQISGANLLFYRNNLRLTSSARGLLEDYIDFTVAGSTQINFQGFTAQEGEIFVGVIDYNAQTGIAVAANTSMPVSYSLPAGQTQVNLGQVFPAGKYSTTNIGSVAVFKDGVLQNRNSGNATSNGDGNYFEVDNGTGYFSVIQFNTSETYSSTIDVIPTGWIIEQGNGSMQSQIEAIQGQLQNTAAVVASLAGQTEQNVLGAAPSNVDLTSFGNTVLTLNQNTGSPASSTGSGYVSTGAQTIAGNKVFNGITTLTNPAFFANISTTAAQGNGTSIPFTPTYDVLGNCASSTFTAPVAGRYLFSVTANVASAGTAVLADFPRVSLNKNGSSVVVFPWPAVTVNVQAGGSLVLNLAAGDAITLMFLISNGHTMTIDNSAAWSFFSGAKIG